MGRISRIALLLYISLSFNPDSAWSGKIGEEDAEAPASIAKRSLPPSSLAPSPSLEEYVKNVSRFPLQSLLNILKEYASTNDTKNLRVIGKNAFQKAIEQQNIYALGKVAINSHKAGLEDLAKQAGALTVKETNDPYALTNLAEKFFKIQQSGLKIQAANKAVQKLDQNDVMCGRYVAHKLLQIGENNLAGKALTKVLSAASDWGEVFEMYKMLKQGNSEAGVEKSFTKLLGILQKHIYGASYLMYVAQECYENKYIGDSKRAAALSIERQNYDSSLLIAFKQLKAFGFKDLAEKVKIKLTKAFKQSPSFYKLTEYCKTLFEIKEGNTALQLCEITFKNSLQDVHNFPELFEIIMLLHKKQEKAMVELGLTQAIEVCKPRDMLFAWTGQTLGFYNTSVCLLMISALSQKCENDSLSQQAANEAIACALAESYDATEELLGELDNLVVNFKRLQFPTLVKKVKYYKAEIESPSLSKSLPEFPQLFDIYWTTLSAGTKGAEIKKLRPCIIVSIVRSYSKGDMVTVVPLSTKERKNVSSIPFYLNGKTQEARLDQVRSIDTSRLVNYYGNLPSHYEAQLRLALKNFQ